MKNKEVKRVLKYIIKPIWVTFVLAMIVLVITTLVLLISGQFEGFIVSMDVRYNSPSILFMLAGSIIVMAGAFGYGVFLSLYKYKRSGGQGIGKVSYPKGNSFKALSSALGEGVGSTKAMSKEKKVKREK